MATIVDEMLSSDTSTSTDTSVSTDTSTDTSVSTDTSTDTSVSTDPSTDTSVSTFIPVGSYVSNVYGEREMTNQDSKIVSVVLTGL